MDRAAIDQMTPVRIDKWLWAARFFKTRSLAAAAVEFGRVRLACERIKPARAARCGDCLQIAVGEVRIEVVVRALSAQRGPAAAARLLYEETPDSARRRAQVALARAAEPGRAISGRPTKRDGRALRRLNSRE